MMYTTEKDKLLFKNAPYRVAITLSPYTQTFAKASGLDINSQPFHEITRQCFDAISNLGDFNEYTRFISNLPMFHLLLDSQKYEDTFGHINSNGKNLRLATFQYAGGIYAACLAQGIILNSQTPYILETVKADMCLLFNTATERKNQYQ